MKKVIKESKEHRLEIRLRLTFPIIHLEGNHFRGPTHCKVQTINAENENRIQRDSIKNMKHAATVTLAKSEEHELDWMMRILRGPVTDLRSAERVRWSR